MNILVLTRTTSFHYRGGFEDHIDTLYEGLAKCGHKITVITTRHPDGIASTERNGVEFRFLESTIPMTYSNEWWTESVAETNRLLQEESFDVIHSQSMGAWALLKKKPALPVIVSMHGTNYDEYCTRRNVLQYQRADWTEYVKNFVRWKKDYYFRDRLTFSKADFYIATSNEQKHIFSRVYGVNPNKIRVVYNGMDVSHFSPQPKNTDLLEKYKLQNRFVILVLARLEIDKGVQFMLDAMPSIIRDFPNSTLLVVGSGGYETELKAQADRLKISDHVVFAGKVPFDALPAYFNLADVFVNFTIRQHGYDLTMVEAMACEKPVIASFIGSHPTLIRHRQNGILIAVEKTGLIAESIKDLIRSPALRQDMGRSGRNTILSQFTSRHMIESTEALFKELCHI